MGENAMQVSDGGVAEFVQMAQDMRLRLREIGCMPLDEQPDAMGDAMDAENQLQAHIYYDIV